MAKLTLEERTPLEEFEPIPANEVLEATVEDVSVGESPFWVDDSDHSKGKKQQVSFKFRINSPDYGNRLLWGNTPTTFTNHPDCKLRYWVEEILGLDSLSPGFELDTDHLEGQTVKVVVGNRTRRDGGVSDYVSDVIRSDSVDVADDIF